MYFKSPKNPTTFWKFSNFSWESHISPNWVYSSASAHLVSSILSPSSIAFSVKSPTSRNDESFPPLFAMYAMRNLYPDASWSQPVVWSWISAPVRARTRLPPWLYLSNRCGEGKLFVLYIVRTLWNDYCFLLWLFNSNSASIKFNTEEICSCFLSQLSWWNQESMLSLLHGTCHITWLWCP